MRQLSQCKFVYYYGVCSMHKVRIGIDIGGTFTDLVIYNEKKNTFIMRKIATSPSSLESSVLKLIDDIMREGYRAQDIEMILHATTIATNALLGQKGLRLPKAALITTKGFIDIIEIGRQRRPELYNLFTKKLRPLIPRRLRFGITERINAQGEVIIPLNENELREVCKKLRKENIEAIVVCFLNSYINPIHEIRAKEIIKEEVPHAWIVISSEVDPQYKEYERTSTTIINAILGPIVSKYLTNIERGLRKRNIKASLFIMKSSGGVAPIKSIIRRPAAMIESGPAAGVIATSFLSKILNRKKAISFDMGGTTAKAGIIIDNIPSVRYELEVGKVHKGGEGEGIDYIVREPVIDLAECSAGGGSIAWIDEEGLLRVGPLSAGAYPGPACYGRGGEDPTVTDANLVLGRMPRKILNGSMQLHIDNALKAIEEKICKKIGWNTIEAAEGILRIVNNEMANIIKLMTIERGLDPREFTLVAYGGAGPLHATDLAEELDIKEVIIPPLPGNFSAYGLIVTDIQYEYVKSLLKPLSSIDPKELEEEYILLEEKALRDISKDINEMNSVIIFRYAELRYLGQSYGVMISVPRPIGSYKDIETIRGRYLEKYEQMYLYANPSQAIELVNLRINLMIPIKKPLLRMPTNHVGIGKTALRGYRSAYLNGEVIRVPVYERSKLPVGFEIEGPAFIEEYGSTTFVSTSWSAIVDEYGNLILKR